MPITSENVVNIACDNPACPGNKLDAHDRAGWTFVSTEVYGEPSAQYVYCCADCAATLGDALAAEPEPDAS